MKIIDQYLKTLKGGLPEAHRDDIVRELSESIFSEIEEKEAELGRPLGTDENRSLPRRPRISSQPSCTTAPSVRAASAR